MKLYYRISDQSYEKQKLIGATKEVCLMNFCKAFAPVIFGDVSEQPGDIDFEPPIKIICDNCSRKTIKMVADTGLPYTVTAEGNAGSLWKTLNLAMTECEDSEFVYFCEDDYLHLGSAPNLLKEGAKRSDYVTLYDHPDKYTRHYNGGEISKVIKTASSHWRYTASTCMTFGVKIGTLREDAEIWKKHTPETHPHDHKIFTELHEEKNRRLIVCIPGVACHTDLTLSGSMMHMLMEPWAIDLMIEQLSNEIDGEEDASDPVFAGMRAKLLEGKQGWERLVALDALRLQLKD